MKKPIALVTDSVSNVPPTLATELGVRVVPASYAFADERVSDGSASAADLYARMRSTGEAPRTFGPTEALWKQSFLEGLAEAEAVCCLVTPFDVASSFTTASAAMLAIQFDQPDARIKIVNPGVGSAGLASLLVTLTRARTAIDLGGFLELIESVEPGCDTLFVPETPDWLQRSGRLALIEDRLGELEGGSPVVRVGTRITGVARAESREVAVELAVRTVGKRSGPGSRLAITIAHADAGEAAGRAERLACEVYPGSTVEVTGLTATIGAQLGPGSIGIGVAQLAASGEE